MRDTTLCLACSCSLPPGLIASHRASSNIDDASSSSQSSKFLDRLFLTPCCSRPICPTCLSHNPRLARYNPCLACLGGVCAVGSSNAGQSSTRNIDAAVRDEDFFTVGDDEEDEAELSPPSASDAHSTSQPSSYASDQPSELAGPTDSNAAPGSPTHSDEAAISANSVPMKYYIKSSDTLLGISLRFGVEGRALCKLDGLPPSTLTTTPRLVHTRSYLLLPPSSTTYT